MEDYDLIIQNGRLITPKNTISADIAIRGDKIAAIGTGMHGKRIVDARGMLVTPGATDIHVHMETVVANGIVTADDFYTGTRAAALGGTTTVVDFVEAASDQRLTDAIRHRIDQAQQRAVIDFAFHMTIQPHDLPKLPQIPEVIAAGCTSFKLYMAYGFRLKDDELLMVFQALREAGGIPVVHAENWDVIQHLVNQNLKAGRFEPRWHPRSRPTIMEAEAAGRLIDLARYADLPIHIFHVSCQEVVERIANAKARGQSVTAETCPHYLYLTEDVHEEKGWKAALPVCSPPLRNEKERIALWDALASGVLDIVSADHAPFTIADKRRGERDYSQIPGGNPSIEVRFPSLYRGVREGLFTENRWVEMCCTAAAMRVGLKNKGCLLPGYDADIVIFNPHKRKRLSTNTLHENIDWTPYEGIELEGWPEMVISRGEIIVDEDRFIGEKGRGKFIYRTV